jgi:hypothetical protein
MKSTNYVAPSNVIFSIFLIISKQYFMQNLYVYDLSPYKISHAYLQLFIDNYHVTKS